MKRIYVTAVPLDSNFVLEKYPTNPVNYATKRPLPACYFPITPVIADTAREGDEIRVIAVRQKNSEHSKNMQLLRGELEELGLPFTITDLTTDESQHRDQLLTLFEALINCMESNACYYACTTFGTKTYPLVLSSALHYAEKMLDDTEVMGVYYRELTRENGQVKSAMQYDVSVLFTLDRIIDMAANSEIQDKQAFMRLLLHPEQEV